MQFLVAGILKPDMEERMLALHDEFNEHLAQPYRTIALAGALRGKDGKRKGYVAIIEAADFEDAEAWLSRAPSMQTTSTSESRSPSLRRKSAMSNKRVSAPPA